MFRLEATWMLQYGHDIIPDWDGKLLIVDTDAHNSLVETNTLPGTIAAYLPAVELSEPRYLSQIVREVSGCTVVDYINQILLMEASYLLQKTSLPLVDIADRLHFSETASFTRFSQG